MAAVHLCSGTADGLFSSGPGSASGLWIRAQSFTQGNKSHGSIKAPGGGAPLFEVRIESAKPAVTLLTSDRFVEGGFNINEESFGNGPKLCGRFEDRASVGVISSLQGSFGLITAEPQNRGAGPEAGRRNGVQ